MQPSEQRRFVEGKRVPKKKSQTREKKTLFSNNTVTTASQFANKCTYSQKSKILLC